MAASKSIKANKIDESLLFQIANGSRDAFERLYRQSCRALYFFLLSLTKNPADAKDLMQETYIRVKTHANLYKPRGSSPMSWIFKIASNLYKMQVRKNSKYKIQPMDETLENLIASDQRISNAETRAVLQSAFLKLSDEERNIVILHLISGLKHRETAKLMEKPLATIISKYNRALKKLRKNLEESGM